jgi:hypothetical protein
MNKHAMDDEEWPKPYQYPDITNMRNTSTQNLQFLCVWWCIIMIKLNILPQLLRGVNWRRKAYD